VSSCVTAIGGDLRTASRRCAKAVVAVAGVVGTAGVGYLAAKTLLRLADKRRSNPPGSLDLHPSETWGNPSTLDDHFDRHGGDFGATSAHDYARMASAFLQRALREGLPTKVDSRGVIRVYDPRTNTFASYNPDGTTKTFYKPDPAQHGYPTNMDYWNNQQGRSP
jgi:pyocin large subunit-like protein